jgi:ankyrin repeat protein
MNKINYESLKFHYFLNEITNTNYQIEAKQNTLTLIKGKQVNKWSKGKLELLTAYLLSHQKDLTSKDSVHLNALKGRIEKEAGQKSAFIQPFFSVLEDLKKKIGKPEEDVSMPPACPAIYCKVAEAPRTERDFKNNLDLLVKHFPRYQLYNDLSIYDTKYTSMPPHWNVDIVYEHLIQKIKKLPFALSQEAKEFVKQELKPLEPVQMGILLDNSTSNSAMLTALKQLIAEGKPSLVNRAFLKCHESYINHSLALIDIYIPESETDQLCLIIPKGQDPQKLGFSIKELKKWDNQQKLQSDACITSRSEDLNIQSELNKLLLEETLKKRFSRIITFGGHGLNPKSKQKGLIGGLSIERFQDALTAIDKKNLSFLYLITCFGGGENATQVHLSDQTIPCPIYIQSSFDSVSYVNLFRSYYPILKEAERQLIPPNSIGHPKSLMPEGIEKLTNMYTAGKNFEYAHNLPTLLLPAHKSDIPKAAYGLSREKIVDMDHWIKNEKKKGQLIEELRIPASQEVKGYLFSNPIIPFTLVDEEAETKALLSRGGQTFHVIKGVCFPEVELFDLLKHTFLFNHEHKVEANKALFIGHLTCKIEGQLATFKNTVIYHSDDSSSVSILYIDSKGNPNIFNYNKLTMSFKEQPIDLNQYLFLVYLTAVKHIPSSAHLLQTSAGRHSLGDMIDALNSLFFEDRIPEKIAIFPAILQSDKRAINQFLKTHPDGIKECLQIASLTQNKKIIQTTIQEVLKFAKETKINSDVQNKEEFERLLHLLISLDPSKPWILENQHLIKEAVSFYPQMLAYEEKGKHSLHLLLQSGHFAFVEELLEWMRKKHNLDFSISQTSDGSTLLHTLIRKLKKPGQTNAEGKKLMQSLISFNPNLLTIQTTGPTTLNLILESPTLLSTEEISKFIEEYKIDFSQDHLFHSLIKGLSQRPFTKENQQLLKHLIDSKPDLLTQQDLDQNTPLHLAAKSGNLAFLKKVLSLARAYKLDFHKDARLFNMLIGSLRTQKVTEESKALIRDIVVVNPKLLTAMNGTTPLHLAAESGNMTFLVDLFNLAFKYKQELSAENIKSETLLPLLMSCLSQQTVTKESKKLLRQLVHLAPDIWTQVYGFKANTPLHMSMEEGSVAFIEEILKLAKEYKLDLNSKNLMQEIPFHSLVKNLREREITEGSKRLIKRLVHSNPDLLTTKDIHGNTPLHLAFTSGSPSFIEYLFTLAKEHKQDLAIKNKEDLTLLHCLIANPRYREASENNTFFRDFVAAYPALLTAQDQEGYTPLEWALVSDSVAFIEEMIALTGKNAVIKNKKDETILHILIQSLRGKGRAHTHKALITKWIKEQPSLLTAKDSQGNTILHLALETSNLSFLEEILDLAKEHKMDLQAKNKAGETLTHILVKGLSQTKMTDEGLKLLNRFIDSNVDKLLEPDNSGKTPLDIAIKEDNFLLVKDFIRRGSHLKWQHKLEKSLFHDLTTKLAFHWEIEEMISIYPALLTTQDDEGNTLFHLAIKNKKFNTLATLIRLAEKNGIKPCVCNEGGQTPVYLIDPVDLQSDQYVTSSLLTFLPGIASTGKIGENFVKELFVLTMQNTLFKAYKHQGFVQSLGYWRGTDSEENQILQEILDYHYDYNEISVEDIKEDAAIVIELVTKGFQQKRGVFTQPIGLKKSISSSLTALKNLMRV